MNDIRLVGSYCPSCYRRLDAYGNVQDDARLPLAGHLTICIYCGLILMFTEPVSGVLRFRIPTVPELAALGTVSRNYLSRMQQDVISDILGDRDKARPFPLGALVCLN